MPATLQRAQRASQQPKRASQQPKQAPQRAAKNAGARRTGATDADGPTLGVCKHINDLSTDVLQLLFQFPCTHLLVDCSHIDHRSDKVSIHNESMPAWHYFEARTLQIMSGVCKLWRMLASEALRLQHNSLLTWGRDITAPMLVTVPHPAPGKPLCMSFTVRLGNEDNGKRCSVERPVDKKAGDAFKFDYSKTEIGAIQTWVTETHAAQQRPSTRACPAQKQTQRLHGMQREVFKKLGPLVRHAQARAKLHTLDKAELKRLMLAHVRSCKARGTSRSCDTCLKMNRWVVAWRKTRDLPSVGPA